MNMGTRDRRMLAVKLNFNTLRGNKGKKQEEININCRKVQAIIDL